tara:strand:- start:131 stop:421 length:291 start_codon:yes stop_codon:yes gene_type:complete
MKFVHCIDTAGSDENAWPAEKVDFISVTAATTVIISFANTTDTHSENIVTLTTTSGQSDEVAKWLIGNIADGRGGRFEVSASSHSEISTVAYSAGS